MATQKPGTKLTIISGSLRGRRCIHEEDVLDKSVDSPVPVPAFRVQLVTEDGGLRPIYATRRRGTGDPSIYCSTLRRAVLPRRIRWLSPGRRKGQ